MFRPFFLTALLFPAMGFAAVVMDPAAGPVALRVNQAAQRQQSAAPAQSPDGKTMLQVKWDCSAANYLEFNFDKPVPLTEFKEGDLDVEFFVPENAPIRKVSFRITDSQGETLQYQLTGDKLEPGRKVVRCRLKDVNPSSWGGKKNGKIDFPANATGISIDFNRKEGDGELWIGKIEFTPAPLDAGEQVIDAAAAAPVNVGNAKEREQSAAVEEIDGKKALRVNWDAAKGRWLEFSFRAASAPIEQFDSARFDVELFVPQNCSADRAALRFSDKNGETFQFSIPLAGLKTGWNLVPLRINGSGVPNAGVWGGDKNRQLDFPIRLTGMSVDYPANSGAGTLAVGKIFLTR